MANTWSRKWDSLDGLDLEFTVTKLDSEESLDTQRFVSLNTVKMNVIILSDADDHSTLYLENRLLPHVEPCGISKYGQFGPSELWRNAVTARGHKAVENKQTVTRWKTEAVSLFLSTPSGHLWRSDRSSLFLYFFLSLSHSHRSYVSPHLCSSKIASVTGHHWQKQTVARCTQWHLKFLLYKPDSK